MDINIISTGSQGNAVVINGSILIDCGVPFCKLSEVLHGLKLVLLTHIHSDHFTPSTVRSLHRERPTVRFCCCKWMVAPLLKAGVDKRVIDVVELSVPMWYNGLCMLMAEKTVHDVPNCCWHLSDGKEKVFYATDTGNLVGISAQDYDFYLVEGNHKQAELEARLALKESAGMYSYERRAAAYHLSEEQAFEWLAQNAGPNSKYILMHKHIDK